MNYSKINPCDIANGVGVRVSLFVSGCRHHCKGCFNPDTWSFDYGQKFSYNALRTIEEALDDYYVSGLSILGGEPLEPDNVKGVSIICEYVKRNYHFKTIWLYTGYLYEQVKDLPLMQYVDVLVDGPFIEELKDITLKFRGSSNQRIIDIKKSRESGCVVLWEDDNK